MAKDGQWPYIAKNWKCCQNSLFYLQSNLSDLIAGKKGNLCF